MSDSEISPPPRCKRNSLPRKIQEAANNVKRPSAKSSVASSVSKRQNTQEPPPKVIAHHYKSIGNNNSNRLLPPPHPSHHLTNNCNVSTPSQNVRNNNEEHIYESLEIGNKDLRLSTDVQCWPWPRQSSLPPAKAVAPTPKTPTTNLAKSIQSSLRSVSLGRGLEPLPSRGRTLLQRLQGLRRSFNSREKVHYCPVPVPPSCEQQTSLPRRDDPDWVFFRGFGAKRREDVEPYVVNHGPLLTVVASNETRPIAPPRRKRPQRMLTDTQMQPLRRSLSFTDAHFIAQAVYEGDTKLIEELYPDFPRSEPIYAVVDKSKKRHSRLADSADKNGNICEQDQVLLPVCPEESRSNSSSSARNSSPTKPAQQQRTPHLQIVEDVNNAGANLSEDKEVTIASSSVMFVQQAETNVSKAGESIFYIFRG